MVTARNRLAGAEIAVVSIGLAAACGMPNRPVAPQKQASVENAELNSGLFQVTGVIDDAGKPKYVCQKISNESAEQSSEEPKLFTCEPPEVESYRFDKANLLSAADARKLIESTYLSHLCRTATQSEIDANLDAVMKEGLKGEGLAVDLRWSQEGISKGMNNLDKACAGAPSDQESLDFQAASGLPAPKAPENPQEYIGKPCSPSSDVLTKTTALESTELGCFFDAKSSSTFSYALLSSITHASSVGQACGQTFASQKDHKHEQSHAIGCFENSLTKTYQWQFVTFATKDAPIFGTSSTVDSTDPTNMTPTPTPESGTVSGETGSTATLCIILDSNNQTALLAQPAAKAECESFCVEAGLQQAVSCSWDGQQLTVL